MPAVKKDWLNTYVQISKDVNCINKKVSGDHVASV